MVRPIIPCCAFVAYRFPGLFWGASLKKIPDVRYVFYARFPPADEIYTGCLGSSYAGLDPDAVHALLDVG